MVIFSLPHCKYHFTFSIFLLFKLPVIVPSEYNICISCPEPVSHPGQTAMAPIRPGFALFFISFTSNAYNPETEFLLPDPEQ